MYDVLSTLSMRESGYFIVLQLYTADSRFLVLRLAESSTSGTVLFLGSRLANQSPRLAQSDSAIRLEVGSFPGQLDLGEAWFITAFGLLGHG